MESLKKALQLRKAKYTKRWKDKGGKWRYEYSSHSKIRSMIHKLKNESPKDVSTAVLKKLKDAMVKDKATESAAYVQGVVGNDTKGTAIYREMQRRGILGRKAGGTGKGLAKEANGIAASLEKDKRLKKVLQREGDLVSKDVYEIEGSGGASTFASYDKNTLIKYMIQQTDSSPMQVEKQVRKRKDGVYVYKERENNYV